MKSMMKVPALVLTALLAACGGGEGETAGASAVAQFQAQATPQRAPQRLAAAPRVSVDEMLDWAEASFPHFFPSHAATLRHEIYSYRAYGNGNYVGISDSGEVVGIGPFVGTQFPQMPPVRLGMAADFECKAKPSACAAAEVYTVFTPQLTTFTATAQVTSAGASGSISIPGFGTASTTNDWSHVTWPGTMGGAYRAAGKLLMACGSLAEKGTRVALSSDFVRVTNLAELAGKSFRENDCFLKDRESRAGIFSFYADGSMKLPEGEVVPASVRDAFFSDAGVVDPSGAFRAQAYKIVIGPYTEYYLVFLNHDVEAREDSVQIGEQSF